MLTAKLHSWTAIAEAQELTVTGDVAEGESQAPPVQQVSISLVTQSASVSGHMQSLVTCSQNAVAIVLH